jgi:hypothetical protein
MTEKKPFLLRVDPKVLAEIQRWAEDDLRSLNGQIEWILRQALMQRKRPVPAETHSDHPDNP